MQTNKHARLSPSNHRWPNCPGSVRVCEQYPDIAGTAAIDGTGTHVLLELTLRHPDPDSFLGKTIGVGHEDKPAGWLVTEDRLDRVKVALGYISRRTLELRKMFPKKSLQINSEQKVLPGLFFGKREDWYGTRDLGIEVYEGTECVYSEVIDYKDGRGPVDSKNNSQLLSYAGGMRYVWPAKNPIPVRMTIIQPKCEPQIHYWDTTSTVVSERCTDLAERAKATDDPNAPLIPDTKKGKGYCRWCPHSENCVPLQMAKTEVKGDIDVVTLEEVMAMSPSQLSGFLDTEEPMKELFSAAKTRAEELVKTGQKVPGYGYIKGNTKREWNMEGEDLIKYLRNRKLKDEDIFDKEVKSPPKILSLPLLSEAQKKKIERDAVIASYHKDRFGRLPKPKGLEVFDQEEFADFSNIIEDVEEVESVEKVVLSDDTEFDFGF